MASRTSRDYSKRNTCIKVFVLTLIALGIFCAIFAMCSCQWFAFMHDESGEHYLIQDWSILPEKDMNSTIGIGIFRYQTTSIDHNENSNTTTSSTHMTAGNDAFTFMSNAKCVSYPKFWVGIDHQWKFTAQLCSALGTILAFVSCCVILVGADRFSVCVFLLLATGVQSATIISSLSWCDQYWNCSWLLGALANLTAACLFLLSWLIAMFGLVEIQTADRIAANANVCSNEQEKRNSGKQGDSSGRIISDENKKPGESHPSTVLLKKNIETGNKIEKSACHSGKKNSEELDVECGSDTIEFYHDSDELSQGNKKSLFETINSQDDVVGCSASDKELYNDASVDDDKTLKMRQITQNRQLFLDLDAKLKERREKAAYDTSSKASF
jgi:hypothetical protein